MEPSRSVASRPTTISSSTTSAIQAISSLTPSSSSRWRSTRVRAAVSPAATPSAGRSISFPSNRISTSTFYEVTTTIGTDNMFRTTHRCQPDGVAGFRGARQRHVRPARCRRPRFCRQRTMGRADLGDRAALRQFREGHARLLSISQRRHARLGRAGARHRQCADHRARHPAQHVGRHGWPRLLQGEGRHRYGNGGCQIDRWRDVDQQVESWRKPLDYVATSMEGYPDVHHPNRDQTASIFANQTEASFRFNTGTFHHNLVAGVEVTRETIDRFGYNVTNKFDGPPASGGRPFPPNPYNQIDEILGKGKVYDATVDHDRYLFDGHHPPFESSGS